MKKAGKLSWKLWSYNTCEHQGRLFNFAPNNKGKLVVSELFLGDEVRARRVNTGVDCKCGKYYRISYCPLGEKILVMVGDYRATDFFCALVAIDLGKLTQESIHVEEKKVIGWESYRSGPFLVQISENRVWASFHYSDEIWIGEIRGDELVMTKHQYHLAVSGGFGAAPLRLSDGRLLVAGGAASYFAYSRDIILITPGEYFSFKKVGDIPGEGRDGVSTILIKERFVVGFGGFNDDDMDDTWIFDLQTKKASPVAKGGEWHPAAPCPFLAIKDGILYILSGEDSIAVYSITLQHLSELVQDLDFQSVFQKALGLELRQYPLREMVSDTGTGMRDLGGGFTGYRSYNTVEHGRRLFHFSQCQRKLCVTEILFGPCLKTKTVTIGIDCKTGKDDHISCCSFGKKILVIAVNRGITDVFCGLVSIAPGELARKSVHVKEKKLIGWEKCKGVPFLAQISRTRVCASFCGSNEIWFGRLKGRKLVMAKHPDHLPRESGFATCPLRLPDGRLLATGRCRGSTKVMTISTGKHLSFEEIGDLPTEAKDDASAVLLWGRFLLRSGGWSDRHVDKMWIFDTQTHRRSTVKKEGEWHPGGRWPVLAVRDKELYVIGGGLTSYAYCLSFSALSHLIEQGGARASFCTRLGFPFRPGKALGRSTVMDCTPTLL